MRAEPAPGPAILLDVTRLVSRIGRGHPTGIDRVEGAWLGHLTPDPRHRLLCRTRFGQLILPAATGADILRWLGLGPDGRVEAPPAQPPKPPLAARLGRDPLRLAAEIALFRRAKARAGRDGRGLARALNRAGFAQGVYLNTGHSNLSDAVLAAMPLPRAVLIHDTIPLDYPQWTRAGQDAAFRTRLAATLRHADLILSVSHATAARIAEWRDRLALPGPRALTAHIGTTLTPAQPAPPPRPLFLTLGTIEPRKNHALLLDAWACLPDPPDLLIIGRRGWRNEEVFARLDALPANGPIRECADLPDAEVARLFAQAHALLFPSLAEGFGLPLTEAAGRGIPVLCGDLPATRELLGDYATCLNPDPALWAAAVADMARQPFRRLPPLAVPGWEGHFSTVISGLATMSRKGG